MILIYIIIFIVALGLGFYLAWIIRGKEVAIERQNRKDLKEELNNFDSHFNSIATKVLREHSKDFLEDFEKAKKVNDAGLDNREERFKNTVKTLSQSVDLVKNKVSEFEKERSQKFGALGQSIKNVLDTGSKMQEAANTLKTVLSSASAVRGRWGEAVLKNLLEESGLTEGIDFLVQETVLGENTSLRPDVIINLPGKLQLAIDSKAGLEEFFKAVEEQDVEKKKEHIVKFAQNLRGHIKDLSSKEYQKHLDNRIPYVIMFIPGEAAVRAVFEQDIDLYREAQEKRVMLASPATIMPLVLLIAHAWKQQKTVENASKLAKEITDLGGRLKTFLGHVVGIGSSLTGATKKFNEAASSWDSRVFPKIEQINSLGGNMQIDAQVPQIEIEPRAPGKLSAT